MSGTGGPTIVRGMVAALLAVAAGDARGDKNEGALEDNSFLLEEAYNQEARVVQHIFNWARFEPAGDYVLTFSQEWPLVGQRHPLAYSIPLESLGGGGRGAGWGDVEIQYRYQWLGMGDSRVAAAPESGLQIVPGIAFPIGIGASSGTSGVLLYLSFEHGF